MKQQTKEYFYFSNVAPPGHKSQRKILKATLVFMYRQTFHKHFVNSTSVLISKVVDKIRNLKCIGRLCLTSVNLSCNKPTEF